MARIKITFHIKERYIKDFESIKEEAKKEGETLGNYIVKIYQKYLKKMEEKNGN